MNIKETRNIINLLLISLFIFGCSDHNFNQLFPSGKELNELKQEIKLLKSKIDLLFKNNVNTLNKINALTQYESVYLDPTSKSYERLDANTGTFLISLQDIKPYAGGYQLTLHIGNPYSARFNGFKLLIKWGKTMDLMQSDYEAWEKSIREKETSFAETLNPGRWNKVELVISPAKADEIEYLELSMRTDVIGLTRAPK